MRMAFEKLGPTFIKLGQLLATRPDLIPPEFQKEFIRLQDNAPTLEFSEIQKVLAKHYSEDIENIFSEFDQEPLAAASIAQVHGATLKNGADVVVKVQRPGIDKVIDEDLSVLYTLAELLHKYIPEARLFNPTGIVDEFFKSLELETNFVVEANNIRRFQNNFDDDVAVVIPSVYTELSGKRVLVMERLGGIPLSQKEALFQEGIRPAAILRQGLKTYLRMVFVHGLFHGDLHAGNIFVLPENRIGLIDFGVVGRFNDKTQTAVANMLLALANEDYERLAYLYIDLAPYTEKVDLDKFARELRDLIAPYHGLTSRHINVGKLLMETTSIAYSQSLALPSELIMFFKSVVTVEGMGRMISADFDFLSLALEFADELVHERYQPKKLLKELGYTATDLTSLLRFLPRQIKQFARKVNNPNYSLNISISEIETYRKTIENSSNLVFLGVVIGALLVSSSIILLSDTKMPTILGLPALTAIGYFVAMGLGLVSFYNYIRRP